MHQRVLCTKDSASKAGIKTTVLWTQSYMLDLNKAMGKLKKLGEGSLWKAIKAGKDKSASPGSSGL